MKITWLGHACFLIEANGKAVVTDPPGVQYGYKLPDVTADVVTISHNHNDHNAADLIHGKPVVISQPGLTRVGDISFKGIVTYHDKQQGRLRGKNVVFVIQAEGLTVTHLGDLGEQPGEQILSEIGPVDILLAPVGGTYTLDGPEMKTLIDQLKPGITIPMHYMTPDVTIQLAPLEDFTRLYPTVVKKPFLSLSAEQVNTLPEVVVLDYHR